MRGCTQNTPYQPLSGAANHRGTEQSACVCVLYAGIRGCHPSAPSCADTQFLILPPLPLSLLALLRPYLQGPWADLGNQIFFAKASFICWRGREKRINKHIFSVLSMLSTNMKIEWGRIIFVLITGSFQWHEDGKPYLLISKLFFTSHLWLLMPIQTGFKVWKILYYMVSFTKNKKMGMFQGQVTSDMLSKMSLCQF